MLEDYLKRQAEEDIISEALSVSPWNKLFWQFCSIQKHIFVIYGKLYQEWNQKINNILNMTHITENLAKGWVDGNVPSWKIWMTAGVKCAIIKTLADGQCWEWLSISAQSYWRMIRIRGHFRRGSCIISTSKWAMAGRRLALGRTNMLIYTKKHTRDAMKLIKEN